MCSQLSSVYVSLKDCLNETIKHLIAYTDERLDFSHLDQNHKTIVLNEFLVFCEVVLTCYYNSRFLDIWKAYGCTSFIYCFNQGQEIIGKSLKSIGYTYEENNEEIICEVRKIDPIVEQVAIKSPSNVCEAMLSYLSARDNDIGDKENRLESLIKQMMPDLQKYQSEKLVSKAKQYSQLIRHKTEKEYQEKYSWFYSNEENYIDDLFHLIVAAQQYIYGTKIAGDFDINSSKA